MNSRIFAGFVFVAALALTLSRAAAPSLVYSVVTPTASAVPSATFEFQLAALNTSSTAVAFTLPSTLPAHVVSATKRWPVTAQTADAASPPASIAPGDFALVTLRVAVPADATGPLMLELERPARIRVALPAATITLAAGASEISATRAPATVLEQRTSVAQVINYFAGNFAPHEPLYFIYGGEAPSAKFQISFKYRLPLDDGWLLRRMPQMRGLHIAYTQRSLWDIRGKSSPFYDTSYMPEMFYQFMSHPERDRPGGITWLGWHGGVQHESNGKADADSRSFNIAYARTTFALGDLDAWHLLVVPRVFTYIGDRHDNRNIADYRGWGDLRLVFGRNDGPALSLYGRVGRGFRNGAIQADLTVPTSMLSGSFATYLHLQYWNGYGESLLRYNRRTDSVRAGFSLVR